MKYCRECGHKNEPVNGSMPKFCSECGTSLGVVAIAKKTQTNNSNEEDPEVPSDITGDLFEISEKSDFSSFVFGEIAVGGKKENSIKRQHKSLDQVFDRLKQREFDTDK